MIDWKGKKEEEEEEATHANLYLAFSLICILLGFLSLLTVKHPLVKVTLTVVDWLCAYRCVLWASSESLKASQDLFGSDPQYCGKP